MPLATVLDNFRILNRHKLPQLMIAKGEGLDIRQELVFRPDRCRRDRSKPKRELVRAIATAL